MKLWFLVPMVCVVVGCTGAHRDRVELGVDGGTDGPDPVTCGQLVCDNVPPSACIDQDTLQTYAAECDDNECSYPPAETECGAAGCCGDHCCALSPSNGAEYGTLAPTGLVIATPNGTFDTEVDCLASSALGTCAVVDGPNNDACVCRSDELTIGTLKVTGPNALVLLAWRTVTITTLLDASADGGTDGPGSSYLYTNEVSGSTGGAGASYSTLGSYGGNTSSTSVLAAYGNAELIPLLGGMRGQKASMASTSGAGGGGGGAVQIVAGQRITVNGAINVGGGGGLGGLSSWSYSGAGGGGSGGAVLLEAPTVAVHGSVAAAGGGGGGGGGDTYSGGRGTDGALVLAPGGAGDDGGGCPLYGYVSGGNGGSGAFGSTGAASGGSSDYDNRCFNTAFVGAGGGGGGNGRIRINTATGCQCDGTFSPNASFGTVTAQ